MKKMISTTLLTLLMGSCTSSWAWQPPNEPDQIKQLRESISSRSCKIGWETCTGNQIPMKEWIYLGKSAWLDNGISYLYASGARRMINSNENAIFDSLEIRFASKYDESFDSYFIPAGRYEVIDCSTKPVSLYLREYEFDSFEQSGQIYFETLDDFLESQLIAKDYPNKSLNELQEIYDSFVLENKINQHICTISNHKES